MAQINIADLAGAVTIDRFREYGATGLHHIVDVSSGVEGELLVVTANEDLWRKKLGTPDGPCPRLWHEIMMAPEGRYPVRLLNLYAELFGALTGMGVLLPPIRSEVIAESMLIWHQAANAGTDLLVKLAEQEARRKLYVEGSVSTDDPRFNGAWFGSGQPSWWALACVPTLDRELTQEELLAAVAVTVYGWRTHAGETIRAIDDLARALKLKARMDISTLSKW